MVRIATRKVIELDDSVIKYIEYIPLWLVGRKIVQFLMFTVFVCNQKCPLGAKSFPLERTAGLDKFFGNIPARVHLSFVEGTASPEMTHP